ncbi:MAG: tryptophan halogenase family protein [Sphingomonadaceae bacterium]
MTGPGQDHIVIVGGGTAGWMAAAALARFAPQRVTLVESDAIGTVGVGEATIPQIRLFNAALGLNEAEFLRETRGSFKLAIEFAGWAGEGTSYLHAFGHVGQGAGLLPFQHHWARARALGLAEDLSAYALNDVAARANRMQIWPGDAGPGAPDLPRAYHFDAGLYAACLRRHAERHGAVRIEGTVAQVIRNGETGDIAEVVLDGERRVSGDFFIDCTGFRALLIEQTLAAGFEDWSHWLPCDRAVAIPCETRGEFTPYTRSIARTAGWQWRIPLQHRIGNGHVYCSDYLSDDEAAATLLANLDGTPLAEPNFLRFTTGMRQQQWVGNCLALGLAAGFMEPLESTSIHLVQSAIGRFLQMVPSGRTDPAMAAEFNRQAAFEWSRIRDFLILHYHANGRHGVPFWDRCRAMAVPETLAAKLAAFRATAYIHREHEELFTEPGWLQVMIGQGVLPHGWNPLADTMPEADLAAMMDSLARRNRDLAAQMPGHVEFLRAFCLPPSPDRKTA